MLALNVVILVVPVFIKVSANIFVGIDWDRFNFLSLSVCFVLLLDAPLLVVYVLLDSFLINFFFHQEDGFVLAEQFSKKFKFSVIVASVNDVFKTRMQHVVFILKLPYGFLTILFVCICVFWV